MKKIPICQIKFKNLFLNKKIDAAPYAVMNMVNSTGRWDDFTILRLDCLSFINQLSWEFK